MRWRRVDICSSLHNFCCVLVDNRNEERSTAFLGIFLFERIRSSCGRYTEIRVSKSPYVSDAAVRSMLALLSIIMLGPIHGSSCVSRHTMCV